MCELTLLVTSIPVVIFNQGWRNPEWTKCSVHFLDMYLYTLKLRPFRDGSHSGIDVGVAFKYVCALDSCCKKS